MATNLNTHLGGETDKQSIEWQRDREREDCVTMLRPYPQFFFFFFLKKKTSQHTKDTQAIVSPTCLCPTHVKQGMLGVLSCPCFLITQDTSISFSFLFLISSILQYLVWLLLNIFIKINTPTSL